MALIRLQNASVEMAIYNARGRALKADVLRRAVGGRLAGAGDTGVVVVTALNDITLEIKDGERVGLIGHNGAGKTTMLRVFSGVYTPTRGVATVKGRVASLIDLAMGLDLEATGHENIIMRGIMLGLSPREARGVVQDVAEFSELGEFLDLPMRTYSTGMMLRLAFAVSTAIRPDIAIFDEVIGVGDASFTRKAEPRLIDMMNQVGILVLASHSPAVLRQFCSRTIWLSAGAIVGDGPTEEVLSAYEAAIAANGAGPQSA
jgi:ABC-2 type transport system ATP-binding protein/lipopolysaccharide transport system ATP-binding protein